MSGPADIDRDRFLARLEASWSFGATPGGGVDRQALGDAEIGLRRHVAEVARGRGFRVSVDAIGNLFFAREVADGRPPILIGSHLDSQPNGGRFDGALGVLAAFECLESLEDAAIATRHPVEVVVWNNEEGCRFAPGAMGSMVFAGAADLALMLAVTDRDGTTVADAVARMRDGLGQADDRPLGWHPAAYLEMHIEQGPLLEEAGVPVGIVSGTQGTRWYEVDVDGAAGHAGTTPHRFRHDAFAAAARVSVHLEEAFARDDAAVRFTIGRFEVTPGSVNTIPAHVCFTIDLRHAEDAVLDHAERCIRDILERHAAPCCARMAPLFKSAPTRFDVQATDAIADAAHALGIAPLTLVSGAFHDALFVGTVCPAGMLFVPCRNGISHAEAEDVDPEDAVVGARVLFSATLLLDRRL